MTNAEKCYQRTKEMLEEFKKYKEKYEDRIMYTNQHTIDLLEYLLEGNGDD